MSNQSAGKNERPSTPAEERTSWVEEQLRGFDAPYLVWTQHVRSSVAVRAETIEEARAIVARQKADGWSETFITSGRIKEEN